MTGDLLLPSANTTGLSIITSHAGIDLGGFRIEGPGTVGTGDGIVQTVGRIDARVRNGSIIGVGNRGLNLRWFSRANDVTVEASSDAGILFGLGSVARGCIVRGSGGVGISFGGSTRIIGNLVEDAGGIGISDPDTSMILDNVVRTSSSFGLTSSPSSIFDGNIFTNNNGGFAMPQTTSNLPIIVSGNICGLDTTCP